MLLFNNMIDSTYKLVNEYTLYSSGYYDVYVSQNRNEILLKKKDSSLFVDIQMGLENFFDIDFYTIYVPLN